MLFGIMQLIYFVQVQPQRPHVWLGETIFNIPDTEFSVLLCFEYDAIGVSEFKFGF